MLGEKDSSLPELVYMNIFTMMPQLSKKVACTTASSVVTKCIDKNYIVEAELDILIQKADIFLLYWLITNECIVYFHFHMHDELHREKWPQLTTVFPMTPQPSCAYVHTHSRTSYIIDIVHPPQLFSLSQHQSSWCVTAAVGYCVTCYVSGSVWEWVGGQQDLATYALHG